MKKEALAEFKKAVGLNRSFPDAEKAKEMAAKLEQGRN